MTRLKVGSKVIIKNRSYSPFSVGTTQTITGKCKWKEHGETVWEIGSFIFRRSDLIPSEDIKIEFGYKVTN